MTIAILKATAILQEMIARRRSERDTNQAAALAGAEQRNGGSDDGSDLVALCKELGQRVPPPVRKPREENEEEPQPRRAASANPGLLEMCRQAGQRGANP